MVLIYHRKAMFYLNVIVVFAIFNQCVASSDIQSQKFDIETDTRTVQNGESMETLQAVSRLECAMICTNVNNCCSGTYEKNLEQCSLNRACNTPKEQSEGSQTIIKTPERDEAWIGMTDIQSEGHWIWDFDMSNLTLNQWPPGLPNGGGSENCGHYCKQRCGRSSFIWNDTKCSLAFGYLKAVSTTSHPVPFKVTHITRAEI
ncbi:unnamed protein product [Mytilus coruscus]|uniref:C-type lectin domain-containing protein n=1 Tax=Mytilus coruscus TaxID=42192 RepID=A0A6J8DWS2_MYTCO|nr:unnamed protein product [Mytilus coruscus]